MKIQKKDSMTICLKYSVLLLLFFSASSVAQGQEDRIRQLERRVESIEKRMNFQTAPSVEGQQSSPGADRWRNRANWRTLTRDMTESEVRSVIGEPHKVDVNQFSITWYWNYPRGPRVQFRTNDRRLDEWSEP